MTRKSVINSKHSERISLSPIYHPEYSFFRCKQVLWRWHSQNVAPELQELHLNEAHIQNAENATRISLLRSLDARVPICIQAPEERHSCSKLLFL